MHRSAHRRRLVARRALGWSAALFAAAPAAAGQTELVSQAFGQAQAADALSVDPALTPDGRFIVFGSDAQDLLPDGVDRNLASDVYLLDRRTGVMERVSVDLAGGDADATSWMPAVSDDARFVAFLSDASDLVAGDDNGFTDVFLRDRRRGLTTRVSVGPGGAQGNLPSMELALSGDGRSVAFRSSATNLLGPGGDGNGHADIFVHDHLRGATTRVSVSSTGAESDDESRAPAISRDGRWVAFDSLASTLAPPDDNEVFDVYLHDRRPGTTRRVSTTPTGGLLENHSHQPALSADGRVLAFFSFSEQIVPGDTNNWEDVFVADLRDGVIVRGSVDAHGRQADGGSYGVCLSPDGRFLAFESEAKSLLPDLGAGIPLVFVKDLRTGALVLGSAGLHGLSTDGLGTSPSLTRGGREVAFQSDGTDLVTLPDGNDGWDVFTRALGGR